MGSDYFSGLRAETPTRVWVNNPILDEIGLALAQGAVGCTTNPTYAAGLLKRVPEFVRPVIAEAVRQAADDDTAAELVQLKLVARLVERFRLLSDASEGLAG